MKYEVYLYDRNGTEHKAELKIRSDAEYMNVYRKCAAAMIKKLLESGLVSGTVKYEIERGNIWTNGGFGSMWIYFNDGSAHDVHIERDGIAWC